MFEIFVRLLTIEIGKVFIAALLDGRLGGVIDRLFVSHSHKNKPSKYYLHKIACQN